jgi:hypothetical protein
VRHGTSQQHALHSDHCACQFCFYHLHSRFVRSFGDSMRAGETPPPSPSEPQ